MNHINWKDIDDTIEEFSMNGQTRIGKIINIYHDHLVIAFPIYKKIYKWNCVQEYPIFCPINDHDTINIWKGKLLNKIVEVKCKGFDNDHNIICNIFLDGELISNWMKIITEFSEVRLQTTALFNIDI